MISGHCSAPLCSGGAGGMLMCLHDVYCDDDDLYIPMTRTPHYTTLRQASQWATIIELLFLRPLLPWRCWLREGPLAQTGPLHV